MGLLNSDNVDGFRNFISFTIKLFDKMFDEYKANVLKAYNDKKASRHLSSNLSSSTPGRIKDECIMMLTANYNPENEKIIRSIFGHKEDLKAYLKVIDKETDKFRPLNYFLKGKTTDPDERVIDLLGWLIGFPPRPVLTGYDVSTVKKEEPGVTGNENQKETAVKPDSTENKRKEKNGHKTFVGTTARNIGILLAVLVLVSGGYIFFKSNKPLEDHKITPVVKNGKYMYWTGDHYLAIPHKEVHGDTPVVSLDSLLLNHLKKITDTNSINYNSIGKVWYARMNKKHYEYFTDSGFHPTDTVIRLRPVSKFIIDNHIPNHRN